MICVLKIRECEKETMRDYIHQCRVKHEWVRCFFFFLHVSVCRMSERENGEQLKEMRGKRKNMWCKK